MVLEAATDDEDPFAADSGAPTTVPRVCGAREMTTTHWRRSERAWGWLLALLAAVALPAALAAHEVRPAYLELTEVSAGRFEVLWKQPVLADAEPGLVRRLPLRPAFPARCREAGRALPELTAAALLERWTIDCGADGLGAEPIEIAGLPRTLTDVLLRVRFADGASVDHLLRPEAPRVVVSPEGGGGMAVPAYLRLGVEHLLFGFDHILFVIGLMFLVRRPLQLVQVVTAFTAAHSITLALSTLGVVTLSQRPVEAVIALSILYLAVELARGAGRDHHTNGAGAFTDAGGADRDQHASGAGAFTSAGGAGRDRHASGAGGSAGAGFSLARSPWAIAFGFGLLHGFGFAGALADIGLPEQARAMALLLFNVGVEIGQLMVVGVLLTLLYGLRVRRVPVPATVALAPIVVMGTVSAYWFVERVLSMITPIR